MMLVAPASRADDAELDALKKSVEQMQQTINTLNQKIDKLERERQQEKAAAAAAPALAAAPPAEAAPPSPAEEAASKALETILTSQGIGPQAPVDPKLRGFVRIPNTGVMLRFNAKPRVDFTYDTGNAGDDNRFVTAKIPVTGDPTKGDGPVFNANGKGSQLVVDVRAPDVSGSPRFYYQNDFFGSGSAEFNYRIQHLYGSIYNVTIGQTFSPFEDPDIWPDTVDYEGPNSMIFARFPLVRYKLPLGERWALNGGLTQPDTQASDVDGATASGVNHTPDFAFNLRGESADLGHVQLSTVFRDLSAKSATLGKDSVFGWGLNLAATLNIKLPWKTDDVKEDVLGGQFTYGEGLGRYGNDSGFFPHRRRLQQQRGSEGPAVLRSLRQLYPPLALVLALDRHLRLGEGGRPEYARTGRVSPDAVRERQPRLAVARAAQRRLRTALRQQSEGERGFRSRLPEPGRRRVLDLLEWTRNACLLLGTGCVRGSRRPRCSGS